jgi:hypothetical protein
MKSIQVADSRVPCQTFAVTVRKTSEPAAARTVFFYYMTRRYLGLSVLISCIINLLCFEYFHDSSFIVKSY